MNLLVNQIIEHFPFQSGFALGTALSCGTLQMGTKISEKVVECGFSKESSRMIGLFSTLGVNTSVLVLLNSSSFLSSGIKAGIVTMSVLASGLSRLSPVKTTNKNIAPIDSDHIEHLKMSIPAGLVVAALAGITRSAPAACLAGALVTYMI